MQPVTEAALSLILTVSVPSTGRSGLQRQSPLQTRGSLRGFSTLYGSKWVATQSGEWLVVPPSLVSVPSTGRSGLQPVESEESWAWLDRFSTLYGSKWVATFLLSLTLPFSLRVSVPSTGRSGLQPRAEYGEDSSVSRFSTLYGSKWVATEVGQLRGGNNVRFQYPLRVEVGCNLFISVRFVQTDNVSVPSTGRSGLQPEDARSGLRATAPFQYPLRVEVGCNLRRYSVDLSTN